MHKRIIAIKCGIVPAVLLIHPCHCPVGHPWLIHFGFHQLGVVGVGPEIGAQQQDVFLERRVVVLFIGDGLGADVGDSECGAPGNTSHIYFSVKIDRIAVLAPAVVAIGIPGLIVGQG